MTTVGWILNLEADLELVEPAGFEPTPRLARQSEAMAERLLASANQAALGVRHVRLPADAATTICQAWCPTPRAQALARAAGSELPTAPSVEVLRRVNHRAFAANLSLSHGCLAGTGLRRATFVTSMHELDAWLEPEWPVGGWLWKRPLGFSGRARKHVVAAPTDGERRWAEASMEGYGCGLMVEPLVTIDREYALHSWLSPSGACLTGQPTTLVTDGLGAWLASEPAADLRAREREQLCAAHAEAARDLAEAGYFGPFSTDAFRYWDDAGQLRFRALSELNARYSMGFFVGFAGCMGEWAERVAADI